MPAGRASGLNLLFAKGRRPDRVAIREFVAAHRSVSITHDPVEESPLHLVASDGKTAQEQAGPAQDLSEQAWVELLWDGLAFDLLGLAERDSCEIPDTENRFDLELGPNSMRLEAMVLRPGQHLAGGANSLPVMRAMLALGRDLVLHFEALEAIVWEPSRSAIGRRFFESVVTAWLDGGAFPALGLTAFKETHDGALESMGLDFWIGQELRIEPPLSNDKVEATRLGIRLINQLVLVGGIEGSERVIAPDGSALIMRLSRNGKFVRVARE